MLGRRAGRIIATAFAQPDNDLSYQHVTFAERDNVIVGMASGYTAEQHRRSSRQTLKQAAGRWHLRMRIVPILFAPLMRIIDSIADGDFYVHAIAVDKELRGDGVGSVLMDSLEDRARAAVGASVHAREQTIDCPLGSKREPRESNRELRFQHVGHGSMLCLMFSITSEGVTPSASARKFITKRCLRMGSSSARTSSISAA